MGEVKKYFKKYTGKSKSIVDALAYIGVKDTSLEARKKIAKMNGMTAYKGTAIQNTKLLAKLKSGKLIKSIVVTLDHRDKFMKRLETYSPVFKKYGSQIHYSFEDSESTFAKAKAKLEKGKKTGSTCVVPCRWALKDIGIDPSGFYGKDGSFKHCYDGAVKRHLKRIDSGDAIGKTVKQAAEKKLLKSGDIIAYKGKTHTFVYSGKQCDVYDGGHAANYTKNGIMVNYANRTEKISEILRWKD